MNAEETVINEKTFAIVCISIDRIKLRKMANRRDFLFIFSFFFGCFWLHKQSCFRLRFVENFCIFEIENEKKYEEETKS